MDRRKALARAYRLLAARDYPEGLLRQRLARAFDPGEVEEALEELRCRGHLDDGRYCRQTAERLMRAGKGSRYIREYLESRGLGADDVAEALGLCTPAREAAAARAYAQRHRRRGVRRILRTLEARGYPEGILDEIERSHGKRGNQEAVP